LEAILLVVSCSKVNMGYKNNELISRIGSRSDLTNMVSHLTKPVCDTKGLDEHKINELATENLIKILEDRVIHGSTTEKGFIVGKTPAVCFQDVPIYGLIQNVEYERKRRENNCNERYRYCGVGLGFYKPYIFVNGGRPVIYEKTEIAKKMLPQDEHWRIVNFDISLDNVNLIDWTHEREWRLPNKLNFDLEFVHVLLYNNICWNFFINNCSSEILKKINGVTLLIRIMY
jgi:hypothetical protein